MIEGICANTQSSIKRHSFWILTYRTLNIFTSNPRINKSLMMEPQKNSIKGQRKNLIVKTSTMTIIGSHVGQCTIRYRRKSRQESNSGWLVILYYIRVMRSNSSLPVPTLSRSFQTIRARFCHVRHVHSEYPVCLTTPCPSTNCRRSAAHPCVRASRKPLRADGNHVKQSQDHIIYGSTRLVRGVVMGT